MTTWPDDFIVLYRNALMQRESELCNLRTRLGLLLAKWGEVDAVTFENPAAAMLEMCMNDLQGVLLEDVSGAGE